MAKLWNQFELLLIGLLGGAALLVGTLEVFGRYIDPRLAVVDGDEAVVYLMVWAVFLASSQLVRSDAHVRPDIVLRLLPAQGQRWVEGFNCLIAIVFCIGWTYCSIQIVEAAWSLDERSATGMEFPMWIYYAAMLAGSGLMSIRYIIRLHRLVFRFDPHAPVVAVPNH